MLGLTQYSWYGQGNSFPFPLPQRRCVAAGCHAPQDGRSSQAGICRYIGEGGRAEREAVYRRLAQADAAELPAVQTTATVTIEDLQGRPESP